VAKCAEGKVITKLNSPNKMFVKYASDGRKEGCFFEN
jgi:hypothetical protein